MKTNKKKIGDVGIRLKPNDPNILENYIKIRKKTKKKKRKKNKNKKKKTIKSIEIHHKKDPFQQIVEESNKKEKNEITITDLQDDNKSNDKSDKSNESNKSDKSDKSDDIKKVKVQNRPHELSDTDPNVKKLVITASLEPEKKKKGGNIKLE